MTDAIVADPMTAIIISIFICVLAGITYNFIQDVRLQRKYRGQNERKSREHFKKY